MTETDKASLYIRKHAALLSEVVCFPSDELARNWRETQVSKVKSIKMYFVIFVYMTDGTISLTIPTLT